MNQAIKTFTEQLALDLKAKLASPEMAEFVAKMKSAGADRSFEVVMSTADEDRQGDELDQSKWDLKYFDLNPVVLWAHNYGGFPIGLVDDIKIQGDKAIATGTFAPEGLNPEADTACGLYQAKVLRTVSPGYIQNDDGTRELLEVSFCSVPAGRFAVSLRDVSRIGLSRSELVTKGFLFETKGAVPYADHGTADPDTAWDGPAQVKACGDDLQKLKAICAWFDSENADVKSAYKLPHHEADGLKAVWKGVAAAMAALKGSRGGVDIPAGDKQAVYNHLAKHYKEFGKEPPDYEKAVKAEELGDDCEGDDGTPGVLADDPKDPGHMICVPREEAKSKSTDDMNKLHEQLKAEHERHADAVTKAIDEFKDFGTLEESHDKEQATHLEKCMKAVDDTWPLQDQHDGKSAKKKEIDEFKAEMTAEHTKHVKAMDKAIDEFKAEHQDAEDEDGKEKAIDEFTKSAEAELVRHAKAHEDMVKAEAEGEDDDDAKKAIEKSGRAISAKNKAKIDAIAKAVQDLHAQHGVATDNVIAALKELSGSPQDDEGEEQEPENKGAAPNARSSTSKSKLDAEVSGLEAYLEGQRILRRLKTVLDGGLARMKEGIRDAR